MHMGTKQHLAGKIEEGGFMKSGLLFKHAVAGLALASMFLMSCAAEIGDIDRTQANKLKKTDLKGIWFYAQTVVEAPVPSPVTFDGEMNFGGGVRVIFDIQEEVLVAYPASEIYVAGEKNWHKKAIRNYWDQGKSEEFVEMYVGQPLASFEIEGHFDVIRDYNAQTGEQSNILVENDTDRKWYERDYIRVNWASVGIKDLLFLSAVKATSVDYYVQEFEEDNPDHFEMDDTSMSFVNKLYLEPVSPDACSIYDVAPYDCAGAVVKVRHSFRKADPNNDYIAKYYSPSMDQGRFGYFLTERWGYDEDYGILTSGRVTFANRHDIWENSRLVVPIPDPADESKTKMIPCREDADCEGYHDGKVHCWLDNGWFSDGHCVTWDMLPPHERTPKPIAYFLSTNWPKELMASAYESADQWSVPFKETVAWMKFYSEKGLYDVKYCDTDGDCSQDAILDVTLSDEHPRFCGGIDDKECSFGYSDQTVAAAQFCTTGGTCGALATCGNGNACDVGQACFDGKCYACAKETCGPEKSNDWQQVVDTAMEIGSFTIYRVFQDKTPVFRMSYDDPIPALEKGQARVAFVHLDADPASAGVTLEDKEFEKSVCVGDDDEPVVYSIEAGKKDENGFYPFRTRSCTVALGKTKKGVDSLGRELHSFDVSKSGTVVASIANVPLTDQSVTTIVLVDDDGKTGGKKFLLSSTVPRDTVNKNSMIRFVHGVPGEGAYDVAIAGSLRFEKLGFGKITEYSSLNRKTSRLAWLPAGSAGEITCYHDNGIGQCMGWKPDLTAEDMARQKEIYDSLPPMFVVCQNVFNGDNCGDKWGKAAWDEMSDCRYWYEDESGEKRNPCKEVPGPYSVKKHGDIRYNQMYWVSEDQTASPLGYGPSSADPETGEIYYGIANIYGASMISYGQYGSDLLDLAEGKLDKTDIMTAGYIRKYIEENATSGASESLYAAADTHADSAAVPKVQRFWMTPAERAQAAAASQSPELRDFLRNGVKFVEAEDQLSAQLKKVQGTWLNGLLMNEEVKGAARGTHGSTSALTAEELAEVSPFNWATPEFKKKYREKMDKLTQGHCYLSAEMYEPYVLGTALDVAEFCGKSENWPEYGGSEKKCHVLRITKVMLDGVLEHEIGHTVGLRHNFESSSDLFNYPDEYYSIRERDYRKCTIDGIGSCVFGDVCKVACLEDYDCMPGAKCKLVEVEGGDAPVKACVDEAGAIAGACWTVRPKVVECVATDDCAGLGDGAKCSLSPEQEYKSEYVEDMVPTERSSGTGVCMVYLKADEAGACAVGADTKGGICLKDDKCVVPEGKDEGHCMYDASLGCVQDIECQATFVPAYSSVGKLDQVCKKGANEDEGICCKENKDDPDKPDCSASDRSCRADFDCRAELVWMFGSRGYLTDAEAEAGRGEYQWASIMDYGGTANFDVNGLGKYDKAAIRYAYGDLTDVYTDTHNIIPFTQALADSGFIGYDPVDVSWVIDTEMMNNWAIFSPWLMLEQLIGVNENLERIPVPTRKVDLENRAVSSYYRNDYDKTYRKVPYVYAGDEWRGNYKTYYFDVGADMEEIIAHSFNKLHEYYVFDAFKRERWAAYKGANPLGYYARIMDRWFPPLADVGRFYGLYWNIFEGTEAFRNQMFSDKMMLMPLREQAETGLAMLSGLLFSPAPGSYRLVDQGTPDERYQNFSYEMDAPGSELNIGVGDGKFPYTTYMADAGYYYFDHAAWIGSFWEKIGALDTLTYSLAGFLSNAVGEQIGVGLKSSVGYNTNFYTELTNLLAGYLAGDRCRFAPYVSGDKILPLDPSRPQLAEGKQRIESSMEGLSMKAYVGAWSFAYLPTGMDRSFLDAMYLCIKGSGHCYEIAGEEDMKDPSFAVKTEEFTDPWSYKTYVAKTANYDPRRTNGTYDMLVRANAIKAQWEAITYGESDDGDIQKDALGAQLRDAIELLDVLVTLYDLYGMPNMQL